MNLFNLRRRDAETPAAARKARRRVGLSVDPLEGRVALSAAAVGWAIAGLGHAKPAAEVVAAGARVGGNASHPVTPVVIVTTGGAPFGNHAGHAGHAASAA